MLILFSNVLNGMKLEGQCSTQTVLRVVITTVVCSNRSMLLITFVKAMRSWSDTDRAEWQSEVKSETREREPEKASFRVLTYACSARQEAEFGLNSLLVNC